MKAANGRLRGELDRAVKALGLGLTADELARALFAWSSLCGLVSFELFGQFRGAVAQYSAHIDLQLERLSTVMGLPR